MRPRQANDLLFAYVTLAVAVPGLSPSARKVGALLLEHLNRKSGQCDPSIERMATVLGMGRTAVKDATAELCRGDDALFERVTHGGHNHRTAYIPRWEIFAELHGEYRARFKEGSAPSMGRKSGRSTANSIGRKSGSLWAGNPAVNRPEIRPQTYRTNLKNKPKQVEGSHEDEQIAAVSASPEGRNGLRKERHRAQVPMLLPVAGGKSASKADAAEAAHWRRVAAEIEQLPKHQREAAWLAAQEAKR
ncbi:helix-turn-helix domain-containing protein [Mesorhizobium microcysteis]|uniref:Helix-turn-helix domain-containing protein n=1 Tax=Neoaquamicrobium microcysteis TaxID=2682781 RepID=A0A5D4GXU6_9HYPH|nr:helix-turn-helix domain-containing protein [Mesorhizobium microcysteis]TYR32085.1 helix-turn-helix domain-containing protein [Mesorhizobium microcysteis]